MEHTSNISNLDELLAELRRIKTDYVDGTLNWYVRHRVAPRVLSAPVGVVIILAGLSIPYLSKSPYPKVALIGVQVAAFIVAALTSLNAFFSWQASWQKYVTVQLLLEHAIAAWELSLADARRQIGYEAQAAAAIAATRELLDRTRAATESEAAKWFADLKLPTAKSPERTPTA